MSLRGLPDFKRPLEVEGARLFHPFEQGGPYLALPRYLRIADDTPGVPEFRLRVVRGTNPSGPPEPYGVVDLLLEPDYALAAAAEQLRRAGRVAPVAPVTPEGGWLRLQPVGGGELFPESVRRPRALSWNGFGPTRVTAQLSLKATRLLERALAGEVLLLPGAAEVHLRGIAARVKARVSFDPATLLSALQEGTTEGTISRADALALFKEPASGLLLTVEGEEGSGPLFAAALVDRLFERFGTPVPPPDGAREGHVCLTAETPSGRFRWNLSEAMDVRRSFFYEIDLAGAARRLLEVFGEKGLVEEVVVPEVGSGVLPVSVVANLPHERVGVLEMGVTLHAPPHPPERVHAVRESVRLAAPEDRGEITLRLAPTEEPAYQITTYAIVRGGRGIARLEGKPREGRGSRLFLRPIDFPVRFVRLEAASGLLELATLELTARWREGEGEGRETRRQVNLDESTPAAALALPRDAQDAELSVSLSSGEESVSLDPLPVEDTYFDLPAFPGYGPHAIEVTCEFAEGVTLCALEMQQEAGEEGAEVLHFTPAQPTKCWRYFADSPFAARYRWRPFRDEGEPAPWSDWQSTQELLVRAEEARVEDL
jgi:hypothetical protein